MASALLGGNPHAEYLGLSPIEEQAVVSVALTLDGGQLNELCSAVMIAAGYALASAHCLHGRSLSAARVSFGALATTPELTVAAELAAVHADLDLMLLRLEAPVRWWLPTAMRSPPLGSLAQLAGFGIDEHGRLGRRLFVTAEVAAIEGPFFVTNGHGLSGACGGDSGGPLIIRDADGQPAVAGILSKGSGTCAHTDRYTRVDGAADWLASHRVALRPGAECGRLAPAGRCFDGVATWCEAGRLMAQPCPDDRPCGWDKAAAGYRCTRWGNDPCRGINDTGTCDGPAAVRCHEGRLRREECELCGAQCRRLPVSGKAACTSNAPASPPTISAAARGAPVSPGAYSAAKQ